MKNLIVCFLIIILFTSCSKNKPEDLKKIAEEELKNGNIQGAIEKYEELVNNYSYSSNSPENLFILGQLLQAQEGDSVQKLSNYKKAIEYYSQILSNYPNYSKAPEATFMIAFIYSEIFKDYKLAEQYYKRFLKLYPSHELAQSVQAELDNLGKTPEEILNEKINSDKEISTPKIASKKNKSK